MVIETIKGVDNNQAVIVYNIFYQTYDPQRAEFDSMNTKINKIPETYPTRVNIRYEMNWAESLNEIKKSCGNPIFGQTFASLGPKSTVWKRYI